MSVYAHGKMAFMQGKPRHDCPYSYTATSAEAINADVWLEGWDSGCKLREPEKAHPSWYVLPADIGVGGMSTMNEFQRLAERFAALPPPEIDVVAVQSHYSALLRAQIDAAALMTVDYVEDLYGGEAPPWFDQRETVAHQAAQIAKLEQAVAACRAVIASMSDEPVEPTGSSSIGPDHSPEAVMRRIDAVVGDIVSGRTTSEQRRGIRSAADRADRVTQSSDAAVGRAIR